MKIVKKIESIFTIDNMKRWIRSQFTMKKIVNHIADIVLCLLIFFSCVGDRTIGFNISKQIVLIYFALYMIPKMYRFFLRCGDDLAEGKEMLKKTKIRADEYICKREQRMKNKKLRK